MSPARRIGIGLLSLAGLFGGLDLAQRFGLGSGYRLPPAQRGATAAPLNATLTSVIITPKMKLAIVKDNNTGTSEVVRVGRPLPGEQNGWTLVEVSPRGATFEGQGLGRQALELAVNEAAAAGVKMTPVPAAEAGKPGVPMVPPAAAAATSDAASQAHAEEIRRRIEERRRQLREEAERMRSEQTN